MRRVYIDSSVVYGAPAKEYAQDSRRFWDIVRNGEVMIIASNVLVGEIERASQRIRDHFNALPVSQIEQVVSTDEIEKLAEQYIAEGVVGESSLDDCRHIALATIYHADAVVSWNFKHMIYRRAGYNDVNEKLGYPRIAIQTPSKFMEASHDENCTR